MAAVDWNLLPVSNVNVNAVPTTVSSPIVQKTEPKITCKGEFTVPDNMVDILLPNTPKNVNQPNTVIDIGDFVDIQTPKPLVVDAPQVEPIKINAPNIEAPTINFQPQNEITLIDKIIDNSIKQDIVNNYIQNTYNNTTNNILNTYENAISQNNLRNYAIYDDINNYIAQQSLNAAINNQIAQNIFARNAITKNAMIRNVINNAICTDMASRMMENMMLAQTFAPVCRPRICRPRCNYCCPRCAQNYFNPIRQMRRNIMAMQMMAMYNNFMTMMGFMFGRMMGAQYPQYIY